MSKIENTRNKLEEVLGNIAAIKGEKYTTLLRHTAATRTMMATLDFDFSQRLALAAIFAQILASLADSYEAEVDHKAFDADLETIHKILVGD